ncbi:MAG: phosphoribosylglycinamide formyltransferase [Phycisphaerales bacterium]|nr:phosphoribosylglycinamide formyltransferase [Phycisphaerales bacterium]
MTTPIRIVALISGGGRTVLNLQQAIEVDGLPAKIITVIATRETLPGVQRARDAGLSVQVPDTDDYDASLERLVEGAAPDVICLCGYLRLLRLRPEWRGRVLNIHPALLPRHGGQGMFGQHVHHAVLDAGDRFSGCTVHFVDEQYDHGPVLLQRACPVHEDDTVDTLAARVFQEECQALPRAVSLLAEGRVRLDAGRVEILPTSAGAMMPHQRVQE